MAENNMRIKVTPEIDEEKLVEIINQFNEALEPYREWFKTVSQTIVGTAKLLGKESNPEQPCCHDDLTTDDEDIVSGLDKVANERGPEDSDEELRKRAAWEAYVEGSNSRTRLVYSVWSIGYDSAAESFGRTNDTMLSVIKAKDQLLDTLRTQRTEELIELRAQREEAKRLERMVRKIIGVFRSVNGFRERRYFEEEMGDYLEAMKEDIRSEFDRLKGLLQSLKSENDELRNRPVNLVVSDDENLLNYKGLNYVLQKAPTITSNNVSAGKLPEQVGASLSPFEKRQLSQIIGTTIGAASMCWENIRAAGVFDSSRAGLLAEELEDKIIEITRIQ